MLAILRLSPVRFLAKHCHFSRHKLIFLSGPLPCTATDHSAPLSLDDKRCAFSYMPGSEMCNKNPYCRMFRPVFGTFYYAIYSFQIPPTSLCTYIAVCRFETSFWQATMSMSLCNFTCVGYRHTCVAVSRVGRLLGGVITNHADNFLHIGVAVCVLSYTYCRTWRLPRPVDVLREDTPEHTSHAPILVYV